MFKRDLSAELAQEQEVVEHTAQSQKLLPPTPKGPPPKQASIETVRAAAAVAEHFELDAVVCIKAEDSLCNGFLASKDADNCHDVTALGGNYFDTGIKLNGARVWKSAHHDSGENPYYMFANVDKHQGKDFVGWFVADQIWGNEKEKAKICKDMDVSVVAWGRGDHYIKEVHFPYWCKKICKEITVVSLWDQALQTSQQLEELIQEYSAPMPEQVEADEPIEAEPVATGKGKHGGGGKGWGKGKYQPDVPHRGGWLPKIAKFVIAVLEQNFVRAILGKRVLREQQLPQHHRREALCKQIE